MPCYSHLLAAAENIKWPMKVDYQSYPPAERKDFENTFTNLLRLQELCGDVNTVLREVLLNFACSQRETRH